MQTIHLDISNKGIIPTINIKQGDIGRTFSVVITENGLPYSIPDDSSISIFYESDKGDNAGNFESYGFSENRIDVYIDPIMTMTSGTGILCLSILFYNGDVISTWNIPYDIEMKPGANPVYPDVPSPGGGITEEEFARLFNKNLEKNMDKITENVINALPVYNGEVE